MKSALHLDVLLDYKYKEYKNWNCKSQWQSGTFVLLMSISERTGKFLVRITFKIRFMRRILLPLMLFAIGNQLWGQVKPIVADDKTVVLDHFNSASSGEIIGSISYITGLKELGKAINFSSTSGYVIYSVNANLTYAGTVEMWVNIKNYSISLLNINWLKSYSYPSSGHVFHLRLDAQGKVNLSGWSSVVDNSFISNSALPLNTWTHLALSWGDSTKIYINGQPDLVSALPFRPAISMSTNYAYLPYWGGDIGNIDEFQISNVQRTNAEIASRVLVKDTVAIIGMNLHEVILATGGSATGSNGSSSYSLGQLVDIYNSGTNGSVTQGIQQAFEISVISGVENTSITLQCSVYPNPSTDFVHLKTDNTNLKNPSYQLYDINGKLMEMKDITKSETSIIMSRYLPSIYFLKVLSSNHIIKSFKIIKKIIP